MKNPLLSKTVLFNIFVIVLMGLQQTHALNAIPQEPLAIITATINLILRFFTNQPIMPIK